MVSLEELEVMEAISAAERAAGRVEELIRARQNYPGATEGRIFAIAEGTASALMRLRITLEVLLDWKAPEVPETPEIAPPEVERLLWQNERRTRFVETYAAPALAEILRAEVPRLHVAERPHSSAVWGPPVELRLEGGEG